MYSHYWGFRPKHRLAPIGANWKHLVEEPSDRAVVIVDELGVSAVAAAGTPSAVFHAASAITGVVAGPAGVAAKVAACTAIDASTGGAAGLVNAKLTGKKGKEVVVPTADSAAVGAANGILTGFIGPTGVGKLITFRKFRVPFPPAGAILKAGATAAQPFVTKLITGEDPTPGDVAGMAAAGASEPVRVAMAAGGSVVSDFAKNAALNYADERAERAKRAQRTPHAQPGQPSQPDHTVVIEMNEMAPAQSSASGLPPDAVVIDERMRIASWLAPPTLWQQAHSRLLRAPAEASRQRQVGQLGCAQGHLQEKQDWEGRRQPKSKGLAKKAGTKAVAGTKSRKVAKSAAKPKSGKKVGKTSPRNGSKTTAKKRKSGKNDGTKSPGKGRNGVKATTRKRESGINGAKMAAGKGRGSANAAGEKKSRSVAGKKAAMGASVAGTGEKSGAKPGMKLSSSKSAASQKTRTKPRSAGNGAAKKKTTSKK
ncbi:hypothetical protein DFJ73DRAFT_765006 [Zopfochytrium polystomum]|nr:hypothetical protein DFJ73DRAFT_765006 [Zopfochytrium polystomum]